jgi:hypothetical protein
MFVSEVTLEKEEFTKCVLLYFLQKCGLGMKNVIQQGFKFFFNLGRFSFENQKNVQKLKVKFLTY